MVGYSASCARVAGLANGLRREANPHEVDTSGLNGNNVDRFLLFIAGVVSIFAEIPCLN